MYKGIFNHSVSLFKRQLQNNWQKQVAYFTTSKKWDGEIFLDVTKFKKEDEGLVIYESKEQNFFRGFSATISLMLGYNIYGYFTSEEQEEKDNHRYLIIILSTMFILFQIKVSKSPKTIWLDINGQTTYIDFFSLGGFRTSPKQIENINFRGYSYYIHQKSRMPIFKYNEQAKKRFGFFKMSQVVDQMVLKQVFQGKTFKVTDPALHVKISKKSKSNYDI